MRKTIDAARDRSRFYIMLADIHKCVAKSNLNASLLIPADAKWMKRTPQVEVMRCAIGLGAIAKNPQRRSFQLVSRNSVLKLMQRIRSCAQM
jgi:hypothetical protein